MIPIIKQIIILLSLTLGVALELGGGSFINSEGVTNAVSHKAHTNTPSSNVHDKQNGREQHENENKNKSQGILRHLRARTSSSDDDDSGGSSTSNAFDILEHGDVIIHGSSCRPVGQCQLCPGGKRSGKNGCETTGKRQAFACLSGKEESSSSNRRRRLEVASDVDADADADDDDLYIDANENLVMEVGKDRRIVYQSCSRTTADEERVLYRFQFVCVIIAFFSLRSVRREKISNESLFDQRKRRASVARQQQQQQIQQQQQQQQLQKQQEMAPLFTRNGDDGISSDGTEGSDNGSAHMNMMEDGDLDTSRKEKS